MRTLPLVVAVALSSSAIALGACAQSQTNALPGCTQSSAIVGGTTAAEYPEAVLVDMLQNGQVTAACSGSLIAPKVVLTAGHCVDGFTGWKIKAPFAGGQTAASSTGETYDWAENGAETVNPDHHDIGLVFLPTAINLAEYPVLSQKKMAAGTQIVNIGRIQDGTFSTTALFVSAAISVDDGAASGFPFDYSSGEVIQSGDSGGPDILVGSTPHTIVSVNSGAGGGSEVLARVDLLYSWIAQKVQAHGGFSSPPPTDGADAGGPAKTDAGAGRKDAGAPPSGDTGDTGDEDPTAGGTSTPGGTSNHRDPCKR